ncbi:MAG TPA: biotin/lipoyl-binding protein [Thermotogota bacterium]|nr:biotin/lipoyl-binding protein [Thermotogota bacterium]
MVKKYRISVNGKSYDVEVEELTGAGVAQSTPSQNQQTTPQNAVPAAASAPIPAAAPVTTSTPKPGNGAKSEIVAPMAGLVLDVVVKKGQSVNPGDKLLILEAMKMENDIVSDISGTVDEINCKKGENVETGEILITII